MLSLEPQKFTPDFYSSGNVCKPSETFFLLQLLSSSPKKTHCSYASGAAAVAVVVEAGEDAVAVAVGRDCGHERDVAAGDGDHGERPCMPRSEKLDSVLAPADLPEKSRPSPYPHC